MQRIVNQEKNFEIVLDSDLNKWLFATQKQDVSLIGQIDQGVKESYLRININEILSYSYDKVKPYIFLITAKGDYTIYGLGEELDSDLFNR